MSKYRVDLFKHCLIMSKSSFIRSKFMVACPDAVLLCKTRGPWWPWIAHLSHFPHKMKSSFFVPIVPTCDTHPPPRGGAGFDPQDIIWTNLIEVHTEMLTTKYQTSRPSSFGEDEFWNVLSFFICYNLWPRGGASFDPGGGGTIWTNLVEIHKEMLYTKYESSRLSSLREEEFWILPSLFLCSKLWPPEMG